MAPHIETLELRPPPFKSLFRYWWRAVVGENNGTRLREREAELFGNTEKRSPLSIRIVGNPSLQKGKHFPLPHKKAFSRDAYLPDGKFNLTLAATSLNQYENIAEIGFLLGGVGNRSRRGFGSIRYQSWSFGTVKDLQNKIYQTLNAIIPGRFTSGKGAIKIGSKITLPNYPVIRSIYFGQHTWTHVDDLLREIGQATHDHCDNALGSANPRVASPIHVRVHKIGNEFVPVVTQLNSVFPSSYPHNLSKQTDFINAIIT